ncbi:MAG: hypothetical protein H0V70_30410 [Ktedonobacteraceae bacterium]|nr:hypothetical protein [Ktedonobacteraceae bacterium]
MQAVITQMSNQLCLCGHILRSETERLRGRCIECGLQDDMNEHTVSTLLTYAKEQDHCLQPIVHMARKAIAAERKAMSSFYKERSMCEADFLDAYELCEALTCIANALSQWAYVAARLWYALELAGEDHQPYLRTLHLWSTQQFSRLLSIHLAMQASIQVFCRERSILLTFSVVDQALDLSAQTHARTKTDVSKRIEALAY